MNRMGRKRMVLLAALLILVMLLAAALDCRMVVRRYEVDAAAVNAPVRVVLVTDLHS